MKKGRPCINNPMQKGKRRQKLHEMQNNVGDKNVKSHFQNFNGEDMD
ncbi:clostri-philic family protein [Clostridium sp. BJN0001]|nr:clostri-philic family protein [Clostridium sp. BJN0001]